MTSISNLSPLQKIAALLLALSGVFLTVINLFLLEQNKDLKLALQGVRQSLELKVGQSVPSLTGVDLKGQVATISYAQDHRKTLLLVLSPKCPFCERNWPNWNALLAGLDEGNYRVVFVNLSKELPEFYVRTYKLQRHPILALVDSQTKSDYKLYSTPQTVLISAEGKVEGVWAGLLDNERFEVVCKALDSGCGRASGSK